MRNGHSASEAIRAIEVALTEMLGSEAVARKAKAGNDYPAGERVIKALTGDATKDATLIKNYMLLAVLFMFEAETGGLYRVRAHHAREIGAAIAREFES